MIAARFHRNTASQSRKIQAHQASISHAIMPNETLDHSLSNTRIYGNRANWYQAAAVNGFVDVDLPVATGTRFYPPIIRPKKSGMTLY